MFHSYIPQFRLGKLLAARGLKPKELVQEWARRGGGEINRIDFRKHVRASMARTMPTPLRYSTCYRHSPTCCMRIMAVRIPCAFQAQVRSIMGPDVDVKLTDKLFAELDFDGVNATISCCLASYCHVPRPSLI